LWDICIIIWTEKKDVWLSFNEIHFVINGLFISENSDEFDLFVGEVGFNDIIWFSMNSEWITELDEYLSCIFNVEVSSYRTVTIFAVI